MPDGSAVDDGHPHPPHTRTNARLYTTSFASKVHEQEDLDRHRGMLAKALELDCTSRLLDFDVIPKSPGGNKSKREAMNKDKTRWNGVQWVSDAPPKRKISYGESQNSSNELLAERKRPSLRPLPSSPFKYVEIVQIPGYADSATGFSTLPVSVMTTTVRCWLTRRHVQPSPLA